MTGVSSGDLFIIPVNDHVAFIGQVLHIRGAAIFVVVFDQLVDTPVQVGEALSALLNAPLVTSWTFDGRFRPGMWTIVTNTSTDHRRLLPASTWGVPETGGVRITNFDETRTRYATAEEAATIPQKTARSPMLIEKFLLMTAGMEPHNPRLEQVRYRPIPSSAELFDE